MAEEKSTTSRKKQTGPTIAEFQLALQESNAALLNEIRNSGHACIQDELLRQITNIQAVQAGEISDLKKDTCKHEGTLYGNGVQGLVTKVALIIETLAASSGGSTWLKRTVGQVLINLAMGYAFYQALAHGPASTIK